jgi:hypothetical protein
MIFSYSPVTTKSIKSLYKSLYETSFINKGGGDILRIYKTKVDGVEVSFTKPECVKNTKSYFNGFMEECREAYQSKGDWKSPIEDMIKQQRKMDKAFGDNELTDLLSKLLKKKLRNYPQDIEYRDAVKEYIERKFPEMLN